MIIDTTFLVDLLRGDNAAHARVLELERGSDVPRVPAPAIFELWEGVERSRNHPKEMFAVRDILSDYTLLALEPRHAVRAGTLSGALARRGQPMDDIDALIAGMALEEREAVLTRNPRDYSRVPDLQVVPYETDPPRPSRSRGMRQPFPLPAHAGL